MFWWKRLPRAYDTTSPSNPPRNPSSSVWPSDSAPLPAMTAMANSNTVPGTMMPAIARHSTHATINTARPSHCGLAVSQPVMLSSHGPMFRFPCLLFRLFVGATVLKLARLYLWERACSRCRPRGLSGKNAAMPSRASPLPQDQPYSMAMKSCPSTCPRRSGLRVQYAA